MLRVANSVVFFATRRKNCHESQKTATRVSLGSAIVVVVVNPPCGCRCTVFFKSPGASLYWGPKAVPAPAAGSRQPAEKKLSPQRKGATDSGRLPENGPLAWPYLAPGAPLLPPSCLPPPLLGRAVTLVERPRVSGPARTIREGRARIAYGAFRLGALNVTQPSVAISWLKPF